MAKLATKILPDPKAPVLVEGEEDFGQLLENYKKSSTILGYSAIHIEQLRKEIERMLSYAKDNVDRCFGAVLNADLSQLPLAEETEEKIDKMNKVISQYISKILVYNQGGEGIADTEEYFLITGNAERIGDHALNVAQAYAKIYKKA